MLPDKDLRQSKDSAAQARPPERVMPRFFFNLTNHTKIKDDRGELCTLGEARNTALEVAAELGRNQNHNKLRGLSISVTDEDGLELFRTPLRNNNY